jgi:hypothetical protein
VPLPRKLGRARAAGSYKDNFGLEAAPHVPQAIKIHRSLECSIIFWQYHDHFFTAKLILGQNSS